MAGNRNFWPIFCGRPQLIIFCPEKFFFQIRPKFLTSGHIESQTLRQIWRFFDSSEKNKNGKNMAGNRNFWPIFSGRPQLIIFWPGKFFFQIRPKFLTSGHIESQNFRQIWQFFDASERIKMVRIWPEIEISGRFLVAGHKSSYFGRQKICFYDSH